MSVKKKKIKTTAKPFLKWAGGKGQLIGRFQQLYPAALKKGTIKSYYEPFIGSGAVFFDIAQNYPIENAYLYDINEELVLTYKAIQKDVSKLIDILQHYQRTYSGLDNEKRKDFYYEQRSDYNLKRFKINFEKLSDSCYRRAAQLIFLNKTCYNGLYRVNAKGEFNVPAGEYSNPTICDENNLLAVHQILQMAEIRKAHFKAISKDIKANSFIYFDPPYRPISKTANFKAYCKSDFSDEHQVQLAQLFKELNRNGALLMLSNSDPKNNDPDDHFFDELYSEFNIIRIPAKRAINSKASMRGTINEIVVVNYPII